MVFYCYLTSAAALWLIGKAATQRMWYWGVELEMAPFGLHLILCCLVAGLAFSDIYHPLLWAVSKAECKGFFFIMQQHKHNGSFFYYCQVAKHLLGQKSPHLSASGSVLRSVEHWHTTSSYQAPPPHNKIWTCVVLCATWQLLSWNDHKEKHRWFSAGRHGLVRCFLM